MLKNMFSRKPATGQTLYGAIVAAARQRQPYQVWGVPDTVDGRFEMLVLHMYLVLERLPTDAETLRQSLTDLFFADMDRSLREMGVGDLSVGKKVRKMAEAFYGRATAYTEASASGVDDLASALARNVFDNDKNLGMPEALAAWTMAAKAKLRQQTVAEIASGDVVFQ